MSTLTSIEWTEQTWNPAASFLPVEILTLMLTERNKRTHLCCLADQ